MREIALMLMVASVVPLTNVTSVEVERGADGHLTVVVATDRNAAPLRLSRKEANELALKLMTATNGPIHHAFAEENRSLRVAGSRRLSFKDAISSEVVGGEGWSSDQKFFPYGKRETICLSTFPKGIRKIAEENLTEIECWKIHVHEFADEYALHGKGTDGKYYLVSYRVSPEKP